MRNIASGARGWRSEEEERGRRERGTIITDVFYSQILLLDCVHAILQWCLIEGNFGKHHFGKMLKHFCPQRHY